MRNYNIKKLYALLLVILISLFACSGAMEVWDKARTLNSIKSYEEYLIEYPNSEFSDDAREKLDILYEQRDWENAKRKNTISEYESFIIQHPKSELKDIVLSNIKELKIKNEWRIVLNQNSIIGFENFLNKYPDSKYATIASEKLDKLLEKEAWSMAENLNTIEGYEEFIINNSNSAFVNVANERIFELEKILPAWQETLGKNTLEGYRKFISKFPNSSFRKEANKKIIEIDEKNWTKATNRNTLKSYNNYLSEHPDGRYSETANARIIDIEVNDIFESNPGQLPPPTKFRTNTKRDFTVYSIYNDTKYTLILRYSGKESFKVTFKPQEKSAIELKNGSYRVTASVDAYNVRDYAGKEKVDGSDYFVSYFISSNPGDNENRNWKYDNITTHHPKKRWINK